MPLNFSDSFWTEDGRNLQKPDIACLRQDADVYNTLMFQAKEAISYDNTGIWITDRQKAQSKFNQFFGLAIDNNADLAITPEYSCLWESVHKLIAENIHPALAKLWVIGCQSIRPRQLKDFIDNHTQVTWILDETLLTESIQQYPNRFFDAVCMMLNTQNAAGQSVKVIIVQFKTMYFGGNGYEWERDNLIRGNKFFVVSNTFASTKLLLLICSDTLHQNLDFNTISNGFFLNDPLLVIHIQLNQSPFQTNYKLYRNLLFSRGGKNYKKEIICLNWARLIETEDLNPWNVYGGSGFYLKSDKLDLSDERINQNHLKGLYYTRWDNMKAHIYFLNYDEHVFLIANTKPSQEIADPTQYRRTGPQILRSYSWNDAWEEVLSVENGFSEVCASVEQEIGDLSCIKNSTNFIQVERIIELSLGNLSLEKAWFTPASLPTMLVKDDEINNRTTFAQDPTDEIKKIREKKISNYAYLKHSIIPINENLPSWIQSVELKYNQPINSIDEHLLNLHCVNSPQKGTGVFLSVSKPSTARAIRESIASLFSDGNYRKNIIVWFFKDGQLEKIVDEAEAPGIRENITKPIPSYKRTKE